MLTSVQVAKFSKPLQSLAIGMLNGVFKER